MTYAFVPPDLVLVHAEDVTERKRAEEQLQYQLAFETLVAFLSKYFIDLEQDEIDAGINLALHKTGVFAGIDRSYVFLWADPGRTLDNTHEWCAADIAPQIDNLKSLSVEFFSWWMEKLERFEIVYIPRVADLPSEASVEKELLQAQDIQSLLAVPLVVQGTLIGFLGFDSVREEKSWTEESVTLLKLLGEIIANALHRTWTEEQLRTAKEAAEAASRTKSEFLSTMSHELRTPLNVILGYTCLLLEEMFGSLTDEQTHPLRRIDHSARELLDLISAVLDLSHLEAGRLPMMVEEIIAIFK